MKVLVTGAGGFIGYHVVHELLKKGAEVIATSSNAEKARQLDWYDQTTYVPHIIGEDSNKDIYQKFNQPEILIHLAWPGLPNYKELFHFEQNLMPQYFFLKELVTAGLNKVTVTGTCFEYGMREGAISTDMPANPFTPYAQAKDTLRRFLTELQKKNEFQLNWIRLFYTYGKGQSEKSLLSQLAAALERGDKEFNMSGGEQLRDFLPVEKMAEKIVYRALNGNQGGVFNCCSGKPITVKSLVETYLQQSGKQIKLNLGYYPYPDYEPMAFWGLE